MYAHRDLYTARTPTQIHTHTHSHKQLHTHTLSLWRLQRWREFCARFFLSEHLRRATFECDSDCVLRRGEMPCGGKERGVRWLEDVDCVLHSTWSRPLGEMQGNRLLNLLLAWQRRCSLHSTAFFCVCLPPCGQRKNCNAAKCNAKRTLRGVATLTLLPPSWPLSLSPCLGAATCFVRFNALRVYRFYQLLLPSYFSAFSFLII